MNTLKIAVASIGGVIDGHSFNYSPAQNPEAGFFDKVKAAMVNKIEEYKIEEEKSQLGNDDLSQKLDSLYKDYCVKLKAFQQPNDSLPRNTKKKILAKARKKTANSLSTFQ